MNDQTSFHGTPVATGRRRRWTTTLLGLGTIAFIGIALAKPWGQPAAAGPGGPSTPVAATGRPATSAPGPAVLPTVAGTLGGPAVAFTLPPPPSPSASWREIRWRRLAPDDPVGLVTAVLRWKDGFIAGDWNVGSTGSPAPLWTSRDGSHWDPAPGSDSATTFWPGVSVVAVGAVPAGLVALTTVPVSCGSEPCTTPASPLVASWTSPDGRSWTPHGGVTGGAPVSPPTERMLLASGPAGLVAAASTLAPAVATSVDGVDWSVLPEADFPAGFVINDLRGTSTGYVAGGLWVAGDSHWDPGTLWSPDGRAWTPSTVLPTTSRLPVASGLAMASSGPREPMSAVTALVAGRDGLVAIGWDMAPPGTGLWWQSSDGRTWHPVPGYPPLGLAPCAGHGCSLQPDGILVGDGTRMVALRGGPDAAAWVSSDGQAWRQLAMTGSLPTAEATRAVVLPGGVLLTDGAATWYGEAVGS